MSITLDYYVKAFDVFLNLSSYVTENETSSSYKEESRQNTIMNGQILQETRLLLKSCFNQLRCIDIL